MGAVILFGVPIGILSLMVGLPLVLIIEKLRMGRWWSYTLLAATTGALVASSFGRGPPPGEPVPHGGIVLSLWTRNTPIIDGFPRSLSEYISTIAFCGVIGGVLGLTFWYLNSRAVRPNKRLERP